MTQPNRPAPRFRDGALVWTPADWKGRVLGVPTWQDGEWMYLVQRHGTGSRLRYAEHELTEAGR